MTSEFLEGERLARTPVFFVPVEPSSARVASPGLTFGGAVLGGEAGLDPCPRMEGLSTPQLDTNPAHLHSHCLRFSILPWFASASSQLLLR